MVLKQEVIDAFTVLGLEPTVELSVASTAYKKLALKHHPDRNYGDPSAHERFQEIGEAWSICQRHFDYPALSQVPEPGAKHAFGNFTSGRTYSADDDVPLDEYEAAEFFKFMFAEMFANRYSYAKGQRYRSQRAGADGGGVYTFSGGFAESQERQAENAGRQEKEKEAYERRVREFEREQAAEQAENDRRAREAAKDQARIASAQVHTFQLAKDGKGCDMRAVIEKFDLDVTKPRTFNSTKNTKTAKAPQFETMLHAAATSCDVALVDWLIGRGADPAALDPSNLTPFHVAISCGNTPVARHFVFLYRNTKSTDPKYQSFCDGCHPSKAIKGTTPLQLAIKSKNIDMVDLLLNDATVHDVGRCWEQLDPGQHDSRLGHILLSKNGFTPSEKTNPHQMLSKKAARKLKQAEEERRVHEEKERKLAQEEENRRIKQARKEKAAKEEAERREKREAERRRQLEEAEAEERRLHAEEQEKARKEAEERARREAEVREVARQQEADKEAKQRKKEKEAAARQKAKEAAARQKEMEAAARRAKAEAEVLQAADLRREEQERLRAEEQRRKQQEQEELRTQLEHLKAEEKERTRLAKEQEEEAKRVQQEKEAEQARYDAMMRRRAEQSARDKARNQRLREERAKAKELEAALALPATSTPAKIPPPTKVGHGIPPPTKSHRKKPTSSHTATSGPPPVPLHTRPKIAPPQPPQPSQPSYIYPVSTPLSPPMTPEDLQTIAIPEDLFRYEPPPNQDSLLSSPISNATTVGGPIRGRGGRRIGRDFASGLEASESNHVGNGVPCRFLSKRSGCARGTQCAFSHASVHRGRPIRSTVLEEELARKNLELERVRAELAAARGSAS